VDALAKRLAGQSDFTGQPFSKRPNLIVQKLNQMNYHARWEAGAGGPRIIFGHCPYAAILAGRPELCQMDAALIAGWMGGSAEPLATIRDGNTSCIFAMGR
jgi:predicted ArsR family transcriptional regulator